MGKLSVYHVEKPANMDKIKKYQPEKFKDVRANRLHAQIHMPHDASSTRQVLKWTMIGQMVIAIALLGFNALGCSVTPTFLFRKRFYLQLSPQLSPYCSKMNKKSMWEVKKNSRFLSVGYGIFPSRGCKAGETMVSKCELILWRTSPVD